MGCLAALANLVSPTTNLSALLSTRTRGIALSVCRYPWSNRLLRLESDMLEWFENCGQ